MITQKLRVKHHLLCFHWVEDEMMFVAPLYKVVNSRHVPLNIRISLLESQNGSDVRKFKDVYIFSMAGTFICVLCKQHR